jgi:uncharacterized protein with FMN-binding domain
MKVKQLLTLITVAFAVSCSMAPMLGKKVSNDLADGVYEGRYSNSFNSAVVRVAVADNRIEKVELVKHRASSRGRTANDVIPQRIVEEQSTKVDAVSGATNSSRVIMNAVEDALKKARGETDSSTAGAE